MSNPEQVAVYNYELTIASTVLRQALDDSVDLGLMPSDKYVKGQMLTFDQEKLCFLRFLKGKTMDDIDPLLEHTASKVPERIAPWALLGMGVHSKLGHVICLASVTMTEPWVEAAADGIEDTVPQAQVDYILGRGLLTGEDGKFTGKVKKAFKEHFLQELIAEGSEIDFVADSFDGAVPALKLGCHQLLVNPLIHSRNFKESKTRLFWRPSQPNIARVVAPHVKEEENGTLFDLDKSAGQANFEQWFEEFATTEAA